MFRSLAFGPFRPALALLSALAILADLTLSAGPAWAGPKAHDPVPALARMERSVPRVLTGEDAALYRRIFAAQRGGHWDQADALAGQLNDRLLMGHVLQQRYTHPAYKAQFADLREWLVHYKNEPGADEVYDLARKRAPKGAGRLPKPAPIPVRAQGGTEPDDAYPSEKSPAGQRWREGLADFEAKRYDDAVEAFASLARARGLSGGMHAAAAFWAARAQKAAGSDEHVKFWLESAADHQTSFYGLLAAAQLGQGSGLEWRTPTLSENGLDRLRRDPALRRAIALVQAGQPHLAELEMDAAYSRNGQGRRSILLALATALGLPQAQLRISSDMNAGAGSLSASLYPVPLWTPTGGFKVDPAFLFALMRQESRFDAFAESPAGARGLMQIMPGTAKLVSIHAGDKDSDALFNPIINLTMGQRYIEALQADLGGRADPMTLAVAYNMGPNALAKWRKKMGRGKDPLLFVEGFSDLEPRLHAKRVLASFWIYCMRFGRGGDSLVAMAKGKWPDALSRPKASERGPAVAANE